MGDSVLTEFAKHLEERGKILAKHRRLINIINNYEFEDGDIKVKIDYGIDRSQVPSNSEIAVNFTIIKNDRNYLYFPLNKIDTLIKLLQKLGEFKTKTLDELEKEVNAKKVENKL